MTLHITRAKALEPDNRVGVLFVNPGGPGFGSHGYVKAFATGDQSHFARYFDIIGVDWRGTGASTPTLSVLDDADIEMLRGLGATGDPASSYLAAMRQIIADLRNDVGDDLLERLDVGTVARDMDYVRKALGEEVINYFGASYGGRLGAAYATLFPDRVRAFVLDAPVTPSGDLAEQVVGQMEGYTLALDRFFGFCAADVDCVLGSDVAQAKAAWSARIEALAVTPLALDDGRILTADDFSSATNLILGDGALWTVYRDALEDLEGGDGAMMMRLADASWGRRSDGSYAITDDKHIPIACADLMGPDRPRSRPGERRSVSTSVSRRKGTSRSSSTGRPAPTRASPPRA